MRYIIKCGMKNNIHIISFNFNVQNGINEWLKMREKRENYEITDLEYLEWKLNYKLKNPLK